MVHGWLSRAVLAVAAGAFVAGASPARCAEQPAVVESSAADASAPPAPSPAEKLLLRYKFQPQQVARYEVTYDSKITAINNGATEIQKNASQTRRRYRVVAVHDDGAADLELTIDWVRMTASAGLEFQTARPLLVIEGLGEVERLGALELSALLGAEWIF